jgi:hypothetical protein
MRLRDSKVSRVSKDLLVSEAKVSKVIHTDLPAVILSSFSEKTDAVKKKYFFRK